jgi:putative DNA primase/helicase
MNAATTDTVAQPTRPTPLPVVAKNIPDELKTLPQWVTWKYELRDNKWTKPPHQVNGRDYAKSSDTSTWGKFEDALKTYKSERVDGIGIMLAVDTGIVGVDLDHCRDTKKGSFGAWGNSISEAAIEIVSHFNSYTEVSPSGTGVRIFVKGKLPAGGRKKGNIEIYSTGRYLTVTGHAVRNRISRVIEPRQAEIDAFLLEHFPDPKSKPNHSRNGNGAWHPSDEELLEKAFAAKNGDKLKALFRGDVGSYPSQSEADLSLSTGLAF